MYMYFKSLFARSVQCYFFVVVVSRSNPDGYGVAPHCLDPGTVEHVTVENFDGQNWEQQIETSDIRSKSKEWSEVGVVELKKNLFVVVVA